MEQGKLIYAMALIDRQIDALDAVINLASMRLRQQVAHSRLKIIQRDLRIAKKRLYDSISPRIKLGS